MLPIKAGSLGEAHWDVERHRWVAEKNAPERVHLERILDETLPKFHVEDPLRIGSCEKLALDAAREAYPAITIIKYKKEPDLVEEPGVDVCVLP